MKLRISQREIKNAIVINIKTSYFERRIVDVNKMANNVKRVWQAFLEGTLFLADRSLFVEQLSNQRRKRASLFGAIYLASNSNRKMAILFKTCLRCTIKTELFCKCWSSNYFILLFSLKSAENNCVHIVLCTVSKYSFDKHV